MAKTLCKKCSMPVTITDYSCPRCSLTWPYYRSRQGGFVTARVVAATAVLAALAARWSALRQRY